MMRFLLLVACTSLPAWAREPTALSRLEALANQSAQDAKACDAFIAKGKLLPARYESGLPAPHASREEALAALAWLEERPPTPLAIQEAMVLYVSHFDELQRESTEPALTALRERLSGDCDILGVRTQTQMLYADLKKLSLTPAEKKKIFATAAKPLKAVDGPLPFPSLMSALLAGARLEDYLRAKLSPEDFAKVWPEVEDYNMDGEGYVQLLRGQHHANDGKTSSYGPQTRLFEAKRTEALNRKYRRLLGEVKAYL